MKRLFILLVLFGCNSDAPTGFVPDQRDSNAIKDLYYQWALASQRHQSQTMFDLSYPGSNFESRARTCKQQWDIGVELYYRFSGVQIKSWDPDGTPYVVGNITTYQGSDISPHTEGFASGARKVNGQWKLEGLNSNLEPDWWR